jgi:hypothetical protein
VKHSRVAHSALRTPIRIPAKGSYDADLTAEIVAKRNARLTRK